MMHLLALLTNWKTNMFYKINFSLAALLLASLMVSSCATNTSVQSSVQSSGMTEFPSKSLLVAGVDIETKHSYKDIQLSFYNAQISKNGLNSEAYLHFFLTGVLAKKYRWYLSKWHRDDGLLAYQLESDTGFGEILFKGKLLDGKYQINDIYSHKYGFWLSELLAEQLSNPADFKLWRAVMNEINDIKFGYGKAIVVRNKLKMLQKKSYFSEILELHYSPVLKKSDGFIKPYLQRLLTASALYPQYPSDAAINVSAVSDDYETALAILDQVESKVGKSKMTLLNRSWLYYKMGDLSQAYHYAIYAYKFGIYSIWPGYYLARYSVETKQYEQALDLLKIQFNTTGWSDDWIAAFDNGKEFINLPSYKKWRNQS